MISETCTDNLSVLLRSYYESDEDIVVELQGYDHKPVGALYMKTLDCRDIKLTEVHTREKYYLYVNGIGIYFTYFRKIVKLSK